MFFSLFIPAFAQVKVVEYVKMLPFLPKMDIPGFDRHKPTGSTETMMATANSSASVDYQSQPKTTDSARTLIVILRVQIQDVTGIPYAELQFERFKSNFERKDEYGYEKSYLIKNTYPGYMKVVTGENSSCKIECAVANRFLVALNSDYSSDIEVLKKIIESMDLDGLSKLEPEK
jgi:hypothetical protein